jgi:hypothetical protein
MATALREVSSEKLSARRAFIVLGMHRSGTSAMTRTLALLGAALPAGLMEAAENNNETGFWEPQSIADLNDEILQALDSEWDDVFSFRPRQYLSNFDGYYLGRAVELLSAEFKESELIVLKDPRISVLGSFWDRALRRAGYSTHYVVMVRNPLEVAESLRARDGFPREKSLLLWNSYMVAADRDTRNRPRTFVSYDDLMSNWRSVRQKIEESLRTPMPRNSAMASIEIDRFLSHRLRHHKAANEDLFASSDVPEQTKRLYKIYLAACQGSAVDEAAVDEIEAELEGIEALVGPLVADLRARGRILEKELKAARDDSEAAKARLDSVEEEFANERSRLAQELEEKKRETSELGNRLVADRADRERSAAETRAEFDRAITAMQADRDRAIAKSEALQLEISELANRLAAAEADRASAIEGLERQTEEQLKQIQSLDAVIEDTRRELSIAQIALEDEKAKAAEDWASFEKIQAEHATQLEELQVALEREKTKAAEDRTSFAKIQAELGDQVQGLEVALESEKTKAAEDRASFAKIQAELGTEVQELEVALRSEKTKAAEDRASFAKIEAQLDTQVQNLAASSSELERRVEERFREIAAITDELRRAHIELKDSQEAFENKQAELQRLEERSKSQFDALEGRLSERFKEIATLGRMLSDQESRERRSKEDVEWVRQVSALLLVERTTWKGRLRGFLPAVLHYRRQQRLLKRRGLFDGDAYFAVNSDVAAEGVDPLRHYLRHGIVEHRRRD